MKSKVTIAFLLAIGAVFYLSFNGVSTTDNTSAETTEAEKTSVLVADEDYCHPRYEKQQPSSEQILQRMAYTTSYNKDTRCPNWVGWALTREHTDGDNERSNHKFLEDKEVPEPRAVYSDIRESECGYQRGHLCPAADNKWSFKAQNEAFLMTNICPQDGHLNQRAWKYLEEQCRDWAVKYGKVFIVAGPLFKTSKPKTVGEHHVAVPDAFFKVVMAFDDEGKARAIGFCYNNAPERGTTKDYARSVDEIESMTGLDFFYQLDDETENRIEAECDFDKW